MKTGVVLHSYPLALPFPLPVQVPKWVRCTHMDYILDLTQQKQSFRSVLLVPSSAKFNYFSIPPAEFCSYNKGEQATLIYPMLPRTHRLKSKSFCPLSYGSQHPLQPQPMEKQPHGWGGMASPSAQGHSILIGSEKGMWPKLFQPKWTPRLVQWLGEEKFSLALNGEVCWPVF